MTLLSVPGGMEQCAIDGTTNEPESLLRGVQIFTLARNTTSASIPVKWGKGLDRPWHRLAALRLNQLTCLAPRPWHRRVVFATMELLVLEYLSPDWVISGLSTGKDACMVKVKWLDEECGVLLEGLSGYADGATRSGGRRYKRQEYSRVEAKILQFDKESCGGLQAYLCLSISLPLV